MIGDIQAQVKTPDLFEKAIVYRTWKVTGRGILLPQSYGKSDSWSATGKATAKCWSEKYYMPTHTRERCKEWDHIQEMAELLERFKWDATDEVYRDELGHKAPHEDCSCGLYGWWSPNKIIQQYFNRGRSNIMLVEGAIAVWGDIWVHNTGVRAEHAQVVGFLRTEHNQLFVDKLQEMYGVPALETQQELKEYTKKFGDQIPDHFVPKVTNPTRKSSFQYLPKQGTPPPMTALEEVAREGPTAFCRFLDKYRPVPPKGGTHTGRWSSGYVGYGKLGSRSSTVAEEKLSRLLEESRKETQSAVSILNRAKYRDLSHLKDQPVDWGWLTSR